MLRLHSFGPADGRPVLALHGLKGHGPRFRELATEQLPHLRVHAPDLRGHGGSPMGPPWTLEQHTADVVAVMDSLGLYRVAVIGHGIGATLAVYLARRVPHRVSRIVLLDPGIGLPPALARAKARDALDPPAFDDPEQAAQARTKYWPVAAHHLVAAEVADHLEQGPDGRWRWRYLPEMAAATFAQLARPAVTPPPTTPTLLMIAGRYGAVSPDYVAACRESLGERLTVTELDCGHQIHVERSGWTGALIRDFLA